MKYLFLLVIAISIWVPTLMSVELSDDAHKDRYIIVLVSFVAFAILNKIDQKANGK